MAIEPVDHDPFAPQQAGGGFEDIIRDVGERSGPTAVSPKGATGSMQVMPATAASPGFGVQPIQAPTLAEFNRVGDQFANALLNHYGGNKMLAAAAYNAGPGAVDRWIAQFGDPRTGAISDADFAARIPFRETRDYAGRIMQVADVRPAAAPAPPGAVPVEGDPFAGQPVTPVEGNPFAQPAPKPAAKKGEQKSGALSRGFFGGLLRENPGMIASALEGLAWLLPKNMPMPMSGDSPAVGGYDFSPQEQMRAASKSIRGFAEKPRPGMEAQAKDPFEDYSFGNLSTWAGETIGQMAASTVPSVLGAVGLGAAGSQVGGPVGGTIGSLTGAMTPSFMLNYGDVYQQLLDEGVEGETAAKWALAASGPITALDAVNPAKWAGRALGADAAKREIVRGIVKRITQEGAKGALSEGATEGIQQAIAAGTVAQASGNPFFTEENAKEIALNAIGGVLGGGVMGTGAGVIPDKAKGAKPAAWQQHAPAAGPGMPPGPAAAPSPPPQGLPPDGGSIGLKFPGDRVERVEILGYSPDGRIAEIEYEDGQRSRALTEELLRDIAPAPASRAETPPPFAEQQIGQDEAPAGPAFDEAPPEPPSPRAQERIDARSRQPMLDSEALHGLDMAARMEMAALDETIPMSTEDRQAALQQAARLRQRYSPEGEESRPGAYRHPLAGEPAAPGLPDLAGARAARPELYEGEYRRDPNLKDRVSQETLLDRQGIPKRPEDLLQFLGRRGGISGSDPYAAGDLQAMDAHRKLLPGAGMLVRRNGGLPLDKAREAAAEAGFGEAYNDFETVDDLMTAIRDSLGGKEVFGMNQFEGDRDAALAWQQHKETSRLAPEDTRTIDDMIDSLRQQAEEYSIPFAEDWTAEDLMAAVTERQAIIAERAGGEEAQNIADARELDMDYYLQSRWPEVWGELRSEGVVGEDPFGTEGQPGAQPEEAAGAGARGREDGPAPGREEGAPGDEVDAGERGPPAPAPDAAQTLLGEEETPDQRRAREGRRTIEEAAQLPRATNRKPQRGADQGLFAPEPEPDLLAASLTVDIDGKKFPVASFEEASNLTRKTIETMDIGASETPQVLVRDGSGKVVAHVAYNGRVFDGHPRDWKPDTKILHETRSETAKGRQIEAAEERVDREPSEAEIAAGNYRKGHVTIQGIDVSIETPSGAERKGVGSDGTPWSVTLNHPYGYVKRTRGADGEQVDVYIGPHPDSPDVFIIDQVDPETGKFDEHKAVLGARTEEQAREIYESGFSDGSGPARLGDITAMSVDDFSAWLEDERTGPLSYQEALDEIPALSDGATRDVLADEAKALGLTVSKGATRAEIEGLIALRQANLTPDAEAARVRDEIETAIDREMAATLPEVLDEAGWTEAGPGGALAEPEAAGDSDQGGEPPGAAAGEEAGSEGAAGRPAGGSDSGGEGAPARLPDGRPLDDRGNPIFKKGERVVLTEGALAGRHGEIIRADGITMRTISFGAGADNGKRETSYHYTVKTDEGAETYASKFEAETVKPASVVADPIWKGKALEPMALERLAQSRARDVERFKERGAAARKPEKKAEWKRLADEAQAEADQARKALADWKAKNPAAALKALPETAAVALPPAPPPPKPADWGAQNTLVTNERAEELRKRLRDKLKNQLSSGIDPEMMAIGAELAAFHIEAGARKFADFAAAIAADLDTTVAKLKPYLRSWYNGARDMMEDSGHDVAGMDDADAVRAALADIEASERQVVAPAAPIPQAPENGVTVTQNADRNGVEVRFKAKPDQETIGKLKAAGFRWSRPQKLWYAKRSDRTLAAANALKGAPAAATAEPVYRKETPEERAAYHDNNYEAVRKVEPNLTRAQYDQRVVGGMQVFKSALGVRPEPAVAPAAKGWREIGQNAVGTTLFQDERGVRSYLRDGIRYSEPILLSQLRHGIEFAVDREAHQEFKLAAEFSPTEQAQTQGAEQGAKAEQDAGEYQPAAMPITSASPPPAKPRGDLFDIGDEVSPTAAAAPSLPPRGDGPRYVTGVSPDGRQVTLDGGAVLSSSEIEPISGHGLQKPVRAGAEGGESGSVPGSPADRKAARAPSGEEPGSAPAAGRTAGARAEGPGRAAERPAGPANRRGPGEIADAGLPDSGARPVAGAAGRPDDGVQGTNFSIGPGDVAESRGPKTKATDNLAAIALAKKIIGEDRPATREEQAVLAKYVGWGGLSGAFENSQGKFGTGFEEVGRQLKELLTPEEYRTASRSTQYAHYTAENVIRSMWQAVADMGFTGGTVFEPGMGIGHFLGMMPADIAAASHYQGLEMDHLTASIGKLLYPQSGVRQADFTDTPIPDNSFDLVIGNPPFSDTIIKADPKYAARGFMLHDYFFAKSMDALRPGGIMAFVTSAGTMNKMEPAARTYMAERAEFLGGVRLPSTAFKKNAGTEVTTDILFFQKRPEQVNFSTLSDGEAAWTKTVRRQLPDNEGNMDAVHVSRYFSENPQQVLGREGRFDKLYKGRYAVHAAAGVDLTTNMQAALDRLPKDIYQPAETPRQRAEMDFAATEHKDGSFYLQNGVLMQYSDGVGRPVAKRAAGVKGGITAPDMERVKRLIPIRDALRQVFEHDLADRAEDAAVARTMLNREYDAFVQKFGPVNKAEFQYRRPNIIQQESARAETREQSRLRGEPWHEGSFNAEPMLRAGSSMQEIARARANAREAAKEKFDEGSFDPDEMPDIIIEKRPNIDPFMDDPESYRLRAIEDYNDSTGDARKKRIFYESVLTREMEPVLNSANDGVLWSLNKFGRFNLEAIADKMGRDKADIVAELGNSIFKVPNTDGTYQTSDEYLSGDILSKLETARAAAQHDPDVRRNVEALEAAMPAPLAPSEISMTLGMPWIPAEHVEAFTRDQLRIGEARIRHNAALGGWTVESISNGSDTAKWSIAERGAFALLTDALNRTPPRIYKEVYITGEGKKREFDPIATQSAQDKYEGIRQEFKDWLEGDTARADILASIYNDKLNRTVLRKYDGSYLTTPGVAADWKWRPHQQRVVARIIQSGNTYVAHAVGAGKTSEMIGAGMEMRRLGLVKKPMYSVPNHMLAQFTKEFYEQYPTARLAVADERRFHTHRRRQFIANVAQDDLDAVIITHSAFEMVPISGAFQKQLIEEELDHITDALDGLDKQDDRITIKRLENQKEKLEQQLRGAFNASKDKTNTFEEMGIDFMFVDEAHGYRKLNFATRQSGLKGITPDGSQMAWDLYSKIRYLESKTPGRSVVLASGTPVTNTMGELFTISRYLQREELQTRGIDHFDSWSATFGDTKSSLEQLPDGGYAPVLRFARFVNIPELYKMVGAIMDVVTPAQLDQFVVRPKLKGGKRIFNLAPKTPLLESYQSQLASRMLAIKARKGKVQKGDDIMLFVINDGRHAAIDMRFVDPFAANNKDSKLNQMIDNVFRIWKETKNTQFYDHRTGYQKAAMKGPATQMIFANLGIGGAEGKFSGYDWIRKELIRKGVPPSELAFVRDYKSHIARQKLFNDMNEGKIRILVGSTQKMGTGVNAQRRLYAIHNQDPLWYPADDEQRVGRGLRQGNMNPEIEIHDYSTKGTYDSSMWQMMGNKGRFIEQFFRGDPELRDMEDLGEASQYEQASAISTSDERLIQLTDLRQQLDKAQRRAAAHDREQYSMRSRLSAAQDSIDRMEKSVPVIEADIAQRQLTAGDAFSMKIGRQVYGERGPAGEAMKEQYEKVFPGMEENSETKFAELGGFEIWLAKEGLLGKKPVFYIKRSNGDLSELGAGTPAGVIRSVESRLPKFEDELKYLEKRREDTEQEIESLRRQIGKVFTGGEEITRLRQEVRDLETALMPKKALSVSDIDKQIEANEKAYAEGDLTDDDYMQRKIELGDLRAKAAAPQAGAVKAQMPTVPQTETPEFKRWFGDSKVVDETGAPLAVYHGTQRDFEEFNPLKARDRGFNAFGSWFSASPEEASRFAGWSNTANPENGAGQVVKTYISIKNPLVFESADAFWNWAKEYALFHGHRGDMAAASSGAKWVNADPRLIRERLKMGNKDGIIIRGGGASDAFLNSEADWYITLEPEQVKSAIGNSGAFDHANPDIRAQVPEKTFYSALTRAVEAIKQERAPAAQWIGVIDNLKTKGVKQEEIDWSGVKDWLGEQKGAVTKADLVQYLKDNEIEIKEVLKGGASEVDADAHLGPMAAARLHELHDNLRNLTPSEKRLYNWLADNQGADDLEYLTREYDIWLDDHPSYERVSAGDLRSELNELAHDEPEGSQVRPVLQADIAWLDDFVERWEEMERGDSEQFNQGDKPRYSNYKLPGGENYRELLLTLPQKTPDNGLLLPKDWRVVPREEIRDGNDEIADWAVDEFYVLDQRTDIVGSGNTREEAIRDGQPAALSKPLTERQDVYRSSHWEEHNILAHIRFDDRTGPNGEKILHIAEVQSDWLQAHRRMREYLTDDKLEAAIDRMKADGILEEVCK